MKYDERSPQPGEKIDEFTVVRPIGAGGMGVVMLASDPTLARKIAIKWILPDLIDDETKRRFLDEARLMARVQHEHVVTIYSLGIHRDQPYIAMEYVPGETLRTRIARGDVSLSEKVQLLAQTCRGIEAIHRSGTVHGDIKPGNVLVGYGLRAAVTDLGLSRRVSKLDQAEARKVVGTPHYIAPEKATARVVEEHLQHRADVYSLGVLAFEVLAGRLPFIESDAYAMMIKHVNEKPPRPSSINSALPTVFDAPILRAMEKNPSKRTPTAEAFRRELLRALESLASAHEGHTFLVADADENARNELIAMLRKPFSNPTIVSASRGESVLHALGKYRFSAIISDLNLPGLNGVELTALLRSAEETKDVPILITTGEGGAADWRVLRQLGANHFLVKPIVPESFTASLRRIATKA